MRCVLLSALFIGTLCAQKIDTEFDNSLDFKQFKTFTIREGKINAKNPMLNNELVEKNLRNGIAEQLRAKGLSEVESKGDLTVTFRLGNKETNRSIPGGTRYYSGAQRKSRRPQCGEPKAGLCGCERYSSD